MASCSGPWRRPAATGGIRCRLVTATGWRLVAHGSQKSWPWRPQPPQRGGKIRSSRPTSGGEQLVAGLDGVAPDGADRQLGDLVGTPDEGHEANPRQQALVGLQDDALLVDEDDVDGKAHEHHWDPIAAVN